MLAKSVRDKLKEISGVSVHDRGPVLSGIVTFTIKDKSAAEVQRYLQSHRINVSYASVPNSRLYMEAYGLTEVVRSSVHYCNTEDEINTMIAEAMKNFASQFLG